MITKLFFYNKFKEIGRNKGFELYAKNTIWLLIEKFLKVISGLFLGVLIARHLGKYEFGIYNYIISFVALFASLSSLGIDVILVRKFIEQRKNSRNLFGTGFVLKLTGSFFCLVLISLSFLFIENDFSVKKNIIIVACAYIFASLNVVDLYFQAIVKSKFSVYASLLVQSVSIVIKIILLLNNASLNAFIWVYLFDSIFLAIAFLYYYFYSELIIKNWKFDYRLAIDLLRDSWPLIFSGAMIVVYMRIDQIMIREMIGFEAVGVYSAASRISEGWYFIPHLIAASLYPAIYNAKLINLDLYNSRLQYFYILMVWIAIIIAIPISFFSDQIINILYGKNYIEASKVLQIHIWAGVFLSIGIACGKWYVSENYIIGAMYKALLGMLVNIIGNYYLIPSYGLQGAAASSLFGHFFANIIYDFLDKRVRGQIKYKFRAFFPFFLLNKI